MISLDTIKAAVLRSPSDLKRMLAKYECSSMDQLWPKLQARNYPSLTVLLDEMKQLEDLELIKKTLIDFGLDVKDLKPGEKGGFFFKDSNGNLHAYDPRITLKVPDYPCTTCPTQNYPKECEVCVEYAEYSRYLSSLGDENLSMLADNFARQRATTQLHQRYLREAEKALITAYMDKEILQSSSLTLDV